MSPVATIARRGLGLLLAVAMLPGCGTSDPASGRHDDSADTPGSAAVAAERNDPVPQEGELFLASPPPGWKETGAMRTPALRMAEYGPVEETANRLERITFEAQGGEPLPDPIGFVLGVSRDLDERCNDMQDINISSGYENGYPTSVRLMICPKFKDSHHGQVVMAKAIQGNEKFYVITRRLQVPPMEGDPLTAPDMAAWTVHLKQIRVCDTRSDEHPCPNEVTQTADAEARAPAETPGQNATGAP